jgi:hypothetical protein
LEELTSKVVHMVLYGLGGAAGTFFVISLVLILAGLGGRKKPLAIGIGGLAAVGWLYICIKTNFFL